MSIDSKTVQKIADLAHLKLTEAEMTHYQGQLDKILNYVEMLKEAPIKQNASENAFDLKALMFEREDVILKGLETSESLDQAPQKIGSAFQVPRILE